MKLIFVYNANSTVYAQVMDFAHKVISPETYNCNLCKITYGAFKQKKDWKDFLSTLPYDLEFLHKDEFLLRFPEMTAQTLPVVLKSDGDQTTVALNTDEINSISTVEELKQKLIGKFGDNSKKL